MKEEVIKSAVEKIKKLWNEYPDFQKALRDAIDISADRNGSTSAKLSKVEHYLALDYAIDSQESLINYSFVKEDRIRNTLEADNREMMRFRYGTRGHKVDFDSYCCYAHFQAEMLLNYFYYTVNDGDLESIKEHITNNNPEADKYLKNAKSLSAISFAAKLYAFQTQFELGGASYHINNARKVRNKHFHRRTREMPDSIAEKRKELEHNGYPLTVEGYINFEKITNEVIRKAAEREIGKMSYQNYESQIKKLIKDEEGFQAWCDGLPFVEIYEALKLSATKVKEGIEKHKKG